MSEQEQTPQEVLREFDGPALPRTVRDAIRGVLADQDAMIEEAVDEQTRAIKAVLMDEMHDHALTCAERDALRAEVERLDEALTAEAARSFTLEARAERAEAVLRDVCIGHADDCVCAGCALAFRRDI